MQTTVAGLEALAQQSKINYTVVEGSPYYEYFKNMAGAEEDLYKKWKDMTLASNADQARYRVWDYPIKEQYTHIFKTIKASGMMRSSSEGFQKVLEQEDGTFAFIHDASQVLTFRTLQNVQNITFIILLYEKFREIKLSVITHCDQIQKKVHPGK